MALEGILEEINEFLDSERSSPEQIRTLAEEITNMTISLTPEQIQDLADKVMLHFSLCSHQLKRMEGSVLEFLKWWSLSDGKFFHLRPLLVISSSLKFGKLRYDI